MNHHAPVSLWLWLLRAFALLIGWVLLWGGLCVMLLWDYFRGR